MQNRTESEHDLKQRLEQLNQLNINFLSTNFFLESVTDVGESSDNQSNNPITLPVFENKFYAFLVRSIDFTNFITEKSKIEKFHNLLTSSKYSNLLKLRGNEISDDDLKLCYEFFDGVKEGEELLNEFLATNIGATIFQKFLISEKKLEKLNQGFFAYAKEILDQFILLMKHKNVIAQNDMPLLLFKSSFLDNVGIEMSTDKKNYMLYKRGFIGFKKIMEYLKQNFPEHLTSAQSTILKNLLTDIEICGPGAYSVIEEVYGELIALGSKDIHKVFNLWRKKIATECVIDIYRKLLNVVDPNIINPGMERHYVAACLNKYSNLLKIDFIIDDYIPHCDVNFVNYINEEFKKNIPNYMTLESLLSYLALYLTNNYLQLDLLLNDLNNNKIEYSKFPTDLLTQLDLFGSDIHWSNKKLFYLDYTCIIPEDVKPYRLSWQSSYHICLSIANRIINSQYIYLGNQYNKFELGNKKSEIYIYSGKTLYLAVTHQDYTSYPFLAYCAEVICGSHEKHNLDDVEFTKERNDLLNLIFSGEITKKQRSEIIQALISYLNSTEYSLVLEKHDNLIDKFKITRILENLLSKVDDWNELVSGLHRDKIKLTFSVSSLAEMVPHIDSIQKLNVLCQFIKEEDAPFLFLNNNLNIPINFLLVCAMKNNFLNVFDHLAKKTNIGLLDQDGYSILHYLVFNRCTLGQIKHLVENYSIDINAGFPILNFALQFCDKETILFFITKGIDLNYRDPIYLSNSLHAALTFNRDDIAELLLNSNQLTIDINEANSYDETPLCIAVAKGYTNIVKILLNKGANIEYTTNGSESPLTLAVKFNRADILKLFIDRNVNLEANDVASHCKLVHIASMCGHLDIIKLLIANNVDINATTDNGSTPIHFAIKHNHLDVFELLIKEGADLSIVDDKGNHLIHYAIFCGRLEMLKLLIDNKINIKAQNNDGMEPICMAIKLKQFEACRLLIEAGAYHPEDENVFPLIPLAVKYESLDILKLLIENNADINADYKGSTALHLAIKNCNLEMVNYLISFPTISLDIEDVDGLSPFELACQYFPQTKEIILSLLKAKNYIIGEEIFFIIDELTLLNFLFENNAKLNVISSNGSNPIHRLSGEGEINRELLDFYLKVGCDINLINQHGFTPLHLAALSNNVCNINCLLNTNDHKPLLLGATFNRDHELIHDNAIPVSLGQTCHNFTPLHIAILLNNKKSCESLLKAYSNQIDIDAEDVNKGEISLLRLANLMGNNEIINLLKSYKRNPEEKKKRKFEDNENEVSPNKKPATGEGVLRLGNFGGMFNHPESLEETQDSQTRKDHSGPTK